MKNQKSFCYFLKKYYNYTMKNFSNKKEKIFNGMGNNIYATRHSRTAVVIFLYILCVIVLIPNFIEFHLVLSIISFLGFLIGYCILYVVTKFTFSYYLFLYLFCYKKIDNEKYSINEQIISKHYLFDKSPENVWVIINKYYKVAPYFLNSFSKVEYYIREREKGKKCRGGEKILLIKRNAIYFDGEKIFNKLRNLSELDNFLKEKVNS